MISNNLFQFILFTTLSVSVFAQKVQNISELPPIKKGVVMTRDGKKIPFRNLHVVQDTIIISSKDSNTAKIPWVDVYKISKKGNSIAIAAISCGLGGLAGAFIGTLNWNTNADLTKAKGSVIIASTVGCALFGSLIGIFIERDKPIYKNNSSFVFSPSFYLDDKRIYASVGVKFNLK